MYNEIETYGEFEVSGNQLRVTDPCYLKETQCAAVIDNALPGNYVSFMTRQNEGAWGTRVSELTVVHKTYLGRINSSDYSRVPNVILGVDSGQLGFFDEEFYPENEKEFEYYPETFYGKACELTLDNNSNGILEKMGVVSSSGFGDGSYNLYTVVRDGYTVAAKVIFIGDEDEDDEWLDD